MARAGYTPVFLGDDWRVQIGEVTKVSQRTGKVTIEITDPEVLELLTRRVAVNLSIREVPEHGRG